ncbi:MAG: GNAT family N-acetyltransferase [Gammaproteobacteria bacterium]|nr:GNAT family N-acetyltransferase [Gammaproteobacteria bacterium]
MKASIRNARPDDRDTIVRFNQLLAKETEDKDIPAAVLEPGVGALLSDPHKGRYFIYEVDGKALGQTMITYEWSDWRNGWFWWIQSVYVDRSIRGSGAFGALYRHIKELAETEPDVCGIRLYVEKQNEHATAVYLALGFQHTHYNLLEVDFRATG